MPRPMPVWLQVGVAATQAALDTAPQARYEYDPYGSRATANLPAFQYGGYYAHASSAVNVLPVRAYAPSAGRWLERDLLPAK